MKVRASLRSVLPNAKSLEERDAYTLLQEKS